MTRKLKIITTALRYPPAPGGAEKIAQQTVLRLAKRGHHLRVYTSNLKCHNLPNATWLKPWEYRDDPSYVNRLPAFYFDQFPYPWAKGMFSQILKEKNMDLIHAHSYYYQPADIAWPLAQLKRAPLVLHPYFYYKSREARKWHFYRRTIGKWAMRADCVIALSEYEKKLICNFFKPRRIEVLPPGIKTSLKKKVSGNIFEKLGVKNKKIILFAGRICYGKGVDVLIRAIPLLIKKHPDTVIALAGEDFGDKKEFVKLTQKLQVENHVIWLGNLEDKNLASAYQNADIFCLPTLFEDFGIVLAEAMAAGLPIVSTDYSAVPYVVLKDQTGFLTPKGDYKKVAYYLKKLLENPGLAQKMGEQGKKEAQKYNWENMVDRMEEIYYSLVKK